MAKLIFIQDVPFESFGIEFLSSYLKSKGHNVDLIILNQERKKFDPVLFLKQERPDIVGFSITTIDHKWSTGLAKKIKKELKTPLIVFGGAHPTICPDMIEENGVDIVCRGEGEYPLAELMENIDKGIKDHTKILNLYVKSPDGHIIRNPLRPLIPDLDDMPPPDRDIYFNRYPLLRDMTTKKFFTGRGCPYNCSYCSNHVYRKLFSGLGHYVRYRSAEKVIDEIKEVRDTYGFKYMYLAAETITTNKKWLIHFLDLYKKEISVPFSCLSRVNELDEEIIKKMADAGCFFTSFGLESGSQRIRNELLHRDMCNEKFLEVAGLLHKYNIKFLVHQIFVLPTETPEDAFETIDMDIRMKADSTWSTIFQPVFGTDIYEYCKYNKLLSSECVTEQIDSMYSQSTLNQPYTTEISNLQKLVYVCLKMPRLIPLVKFLIKLPPNPFFELISKWNMLISFRLRYRLGYLEMIRIYIDSNKRFG